MHVYFSIRLCSYLTDPFKEEMKFQIWEGQITHI